MLEKEEVAYEKTILVGVVTRDQDEEKLAEFLDELEFLTFTAGGEVVKRFTQKVDMPNSKTFIGSGKIEEVKTYIDQHGVGTIVFDDELTPSQQKNIEKERQKGGIGMRGPGETEIETDRRIVRDRITLLKKKLQTIDKQMSTQRGNRGKLVRVALVGYTNVGKSTLMNVISKSKVFAENKLFATLDTTVRKVVIGNLPFLLSDTVGFIRKLPTQLVESFKSTLDEVREADLLLHVVDISHPQFER